MKRLLLLLILQVSFLSLTQAQCTYENKAFSGYEGINYNLYFNWQFVWIKAGTASMVTQPIMYYGKKAYRSSLVTKSSAKVDKYFMMRDTIMAYFSQNLTPLYYRKGAREGKRYYVDELWYTYPDGKCQTTTKHLTSSGEVWSQKATFDNCVSDMLNSFMRVRNMDPKGWKEGHVVPLDIAGGDKIIKAKLVYKGKKVVKADDKQKYNCLVLSYIEKEDGKDHEIVRFFVSDDQRHIPIRLDLFLKFGSAKAFLSSMK